MSRQGRTAEHISASSHCVGEILAACSDFFEASGMRDAQRESRDVVAALLDVPKFWPTANLTSPAASDLREHALRAAEKRLAGAPLAYAVGRACFRHLTLDVDERVLIPRVETEILVERILQRCTGDIQTIADIGTGSGAIALSLAFERKFNRVIATDISLDALAVAKSNAESLGHLLKSTVEFRHGALLAPLAGEKLDAIVSNPPYISFAEAGELPRDVRDWEPLVALVCAQDGLAVTRDLIRGAAELLTPNGVMAFEVDTRRAGTVAEIIAVDGRYRDVEVLLDLTGRERFVFARRAS
ncbi:MAG TPA: peptide chain release factor N(5)-glutamine methyltransferase [Gemmatimonadaceae bacterium]|nr:peptide chain release factor N(5)-glutamine methyltransferase [Gemmatimonadaceae bacterium]